MDLFKLSQQENSSGPFNCKCHQKESQSQAKKDDKGISRGFPKSSSCVDFHEDSVLSAALKRKHERRFSVDQHTYFDDEYWPSELGLS